MLKRVIEIALEAAGVIRSYYEGGFKVTLKKDKSPLTEADREADRLIARGLERINRDIPVVSEESAVPGYGVRRKWARFWLVDPLDGTKEFIRREREFTVNIALIERGRPRLGVIAAPALGLVYYASDGNGAWKLGRRGKPRRIFSKKPRGGGTVILLDSRHHSSPEFSVYRKKMGRTKVLRMGSSLKFCLLAEGRAHVYARFNPTMEWDVAAGDCIFRNAARRGRNPSPLRYNKPRLKNGPFVMGTITEPFR